MNGDWMTLDELFDGTGGVPDLDDEERKRDEVAKLERKGLVETKAQNGTVFCQLTSKAVQKILNGELGVLENLKQTDGENQ